MDLGYTEYYKFIKSIYPLPKDDFDVLLSFSTPIQLKPKTQFVELGKKTDKMFLLVKGVVRSFYLLENGKEITKSLFADMELCSSLTALIKNEPSKIIYESLTDCYVLELKYDKFKELCSTNSEVLKLYVSYLENIFINNERKHLEILSKNAKDRYLNLRKKYPKVDNLIPQYQIAAYLNITPVQLSRIRSEL